MTDSKNNTGNKNTGNRNTGYKNTGNKNTGNRNTGYKNTGYKNTGDWNTGDWNTGDWNTGDWNAGYKNTGDWNACDKETGFFNSVQSGNVRVFNKDCPREEWSAADRPDFLYFDLTEWISDSDMTDQEKTDNPTFETTGGYLKPYGYKEAFQKSWDAAGEEDRAKLFKLPNFDAEVFKEISGIDVTEKAQSCAGKVIEIEGKKYKLTEVK